MEKNDSVACDKERLGKIVLLVKTGSNHFFQTRMLFENESSFCGIELIKLFEKDHYSGATVILSIFYEYGNLGNYKYFYLFVISVRTKNLLCYGKGDHLQF